MISAGLTPTGSSSSRTASRHDHLRGENIYLRRGGACAVGPSGRAGRRSVRHSHDEKWGESVKAVVELSASASTSEDELIEWCRGRLARYKCPKSVDIVEALPRNPTGKLLKRDPAQALLGEPRPRHLMVEIGDLLDRLHVVALLYAGSVPGHHRT